MKSRHVRKPPLAKGWKRSQPGVCRWCRKHVVENGTVNRRKRWHDKCLKIYLIASRQDFARDAVERRDAVDGVITCACCSKACKSDSNEWEMDHITPLWRAPLQLKFWLLGNMQALCVECHKAKTAREATERAAIKRGDL